MQLERRGLTVEDGSLHNLGLGMPCGYRLDAAHLDGVARLRLSGEVDSHDAPPLLGELLAYGEVHGWTIVLDATGVEYLGSAGLASLIAAREQLVERGGSLRIEQASTILQQVLWATGTEALFAS